VRDGDKPVVQAEREERSVAEGTRDTIRTREGYGTAVEEEVAERLGTPRGSVTATRSRASSNSTTSPGKAFVRRVAEAPRRQSPPRHPASRWNQVALSLMTAQRGRAHRQDFDMAGRFDELTGCDHSRARRADRRHQPAGLPGPAWSARLAGHGRSATGRAQPGRSAGRALAGPTWRTARWQAFADTIIPAQGDEDRSRNEIHSRAIAGVARCPGPWRPTCSRSTTHPNVGFDSPRPTFLADLQASLSQGGDFLCAGIRPPREGGAWPASPSTTGRVLWEAGGGPCLSTGLSVPPR